jgi:SAM-dependent methyltransferase
MKFEVEEIPCPLCGCKKNNLYDRNKEWKIVKCNDCDFCYTNPRPTPESLPGFYDAAYFKDERHRAKFFNEDGTSITKGSENFSGRIQEIENFMSSRGKLLEIGAARGYFLQAMRELGWDVRGVEISDDAVAFAQQHFGINLFHGTIEQYDIENGFDVVCMYQTLEHVADPAYLVERSLELLTSGGLFVAEVPNLDAFELKYSAERRKLSYDLPRHLNHFTADTLQTLLKKRGFKVELIKRYYPPYLLKLSSIISGKPAVKQIGSLASVAVPAGHNEESIPENLPMASIPKSWKQELMNGISTFTPGWRVTAIARKP